jgi:arginase
MIDKIRIIGIPIDLGQVLRGVDMGPGAVRYAGLTEKLRKLGYKVTDCGNIDVPVRASLDDEGEGIILDALTEANRKVYTAAENSVRSGEIPIFIGGDHSLAIGTIGGMTHYERRGIIWIDAHGDFNTPETSYSGNTHGMPVSTLLGEGYGELVNIGREGAKIPPEDVILIGLRDLDKDEQILIKESGVSYYTMRDIDENGISMIMHRALAKLSHLRKIHVSLDMDAMDPTDAPGVGTPVKGGLTYREAQLMMEIISDTGKAGSMDIVEINPMLDKYNKTANFAVDLALSLFGKKII